MVAGGSTAVLGGTVDLAETADTNGLAEVDVAGDRGGADVEPVNVLGRELAGRTSLDGINPTWAVLAGTSLCCTGAKYIPGMGSLP